MKKPKIIILDLNDCKYLGELHLRLKKAFDFPEWYGENWDAFWDLIDGMRENTIVEIKGLHSLPEDLKPSGNMIVSLLQENKDGMVELKKRCPDFDCRFEYKIID